ncbi:MAG: cysteine desulfurase family protein [Balneolaceae bacterium]
MRNGLVSRFGHPPIADHQTVLYNKYQIFAMDLVYFDHAATTPIDKRVLEAMMPYLKSEYGNASSPHHKGHTAKVAIEESREQIASLIHAEPSEIVFTSGGTECDNALIRGAIEVSGDKKEIITSTVEHHAVLHTVESLKRHGCKPVYLEPDSDGTVSPEQVEEAINDSTALVTLMHINNEVGGFNPIGEIAEVCRTHNVPFHSDTVQSIGKIPVNVKKLGIDFLSMSAHKIYGPKGVGAMYIKNGAPWIPWMTGGSQERRRRGGTSNVPGIVGFAKAFKLSAKEMDDRRSHFVDLRNHLIGGLKDRFEGRFQINGPENGGAPHIVNIGLIPPDNHKLDGEMLLLNLDIEGVCVSNGSACTSGAVDPSHVLTNIGVEERIAASSMRLSFGKDNTTEQIDHFLDKLDGVLNRMMEKAQRA